jgi:uncharacterized protein (DUF2147 family)
MNMKHLMLGLTLSACYTIGHAATPTDELSGIWRTIDDRTGFSKALVRIDKAKDGSFQGTIVKILPRPDYTPQEFCQHCPAPYTNKPILGLTILTGLKPEEQEHRYGGARVIDPLSGRVYSGKARLSNDGRRLSMRGYVGISMLGRSQSWVRESEEALKADKFE